MKFRGLTITLEREKLPNTILFDLVEEEAGGTVLPSYRMLRDLIGAEQFTAVRNKIDPDDDLREVIGELLESIFEQYGLTVGK